MKKSQKKIVNAAVFVLLAYFVTRPMYYPGVGDNPKPRRISVQLQPQGRIVSFGEMDNFLNVWSEFLEQSFSSEDMPAMLTAETAYGKKLSSRAQRWIKAQGWDADRFFYTGRRLRSAVKACRLKALAQQTRESSGDSAGADGRSRYPQQHQKTDGRTRPDVSGRECQRKRNRNGHAAS